MDALHDQSNGERLQRVLAAAGVGPRRACERMIEEGRVKVNGRVEGDPNRWVDLERDAISVDDRPLEKAAPVYLLLHKPAGYLTTYRDPEGRPTIFDLLPDREQYLFPVGRLDLDTSGLLILTNDTAFAERLTNPDYKVPKTYLVKASKYLDDEALARAHGVAGRARVLREFSRDEMARAMVQLYSP
jgi:16S rRNA U516 pseudouridylate synthase RsuA-like enzyme